MNAIEVETTRQIVENWLAMSKDEHGRATEQLKRFNLVEVVSIVTNYAHHENYRLRRVAPWILLPLDRTASMSAAIDGLHDPEKQVRLDAVGMLHNLRDAAAVPGLIQVILNDSDADIRVNACHALMLIGDPRALPALEWVAQNDFALNFEDCSVSDYAHEAIKSINRSG